MTLQDTVYYYQGAPAMSRIERIRADWEAAKKMGHCDHVRVDDIVALLEAYDFLVAKAMGR